MVVFLFTAVLGSGVPLPKILNIDFSNADIDVLEVRRELCSALCSMPRSWEEEEKGGERWGNGGLFLQRMGLWEQETKVKNPSMKPSPSTISFHPQERCHCPQLADGNTEAQSRKGLAHSRSAI